MAHHPLSNFDKFLLSLDNFPTTRLRIFTTIGLIQLTGIMHLYKVNQLCTQVGPCVVWEPSPNWLLFLSILVGVDVSQYVAKSVTALKHARIAQLTSNEPLASEDTTRSTDITEFYNEETKG